MGIGLCAGRGPEREGGGSGQGQEETRWAALHPPFFGTCRATLSAVAEF